MDEELINLSTEETFEVDDEEVVELQIEAEDLEQNIETEETLDVIEVDAIEEIEIEVDEAIGWVGGDSTRHYSLYGRDEPDQHPIVAITGLRDELDNIEKLQTIFSDKKGQADYYLWHDKNPSQEIRAGYFVSLCEDTNEIRICTGDNMFGVTVDAAGFIGGQTNIARDITYGLVVYDGAAAVRCELDVAVNDYVIPDNDGRAKKADNGYGYKVVALQEIDGVKYAVINLQIEINKIRDLVDNVNNLDERVEEAESNIVSAINVANAAYNKAGEAGYVSEEALKDALEALNKSNETSDKVNELESNVTSTNEVAVQAKAIAESVVTSVETIRKEAEDTANNALTNVNNLIKDLEPITTWQDPTTGNTGAEYFTNYIENGLATNVYVSEVVTKTEENKSAIETNAEKFQTLVSSVDKYSVGEYSQAYGLTREQAISILKVGYIYIPTAHKDTPSHSEIFVGESEPQWFTPTNYYEWDGNDWIEYLHSVACSNIEPALTGTLKYWYIDSNTAPAGYEPHALYVNIDGEWQKVNILDGNVNNRITSMIRQTTNEIALEIVNTQGNVTSHQQWIDNNSANIQGVVTWKSDVEKDVSEIATIKQTATDLGASIALVVTEKDGENVINAASIVTAINNGESSVVINADHVDLSGIDVSLTGKTINISASDVLGIESTNFKVNTNGEITATGGTIGGWTIDGDKITKTAGTYTTTLDASTGKIISNNIEAIGGNIGGWTIEENQLSYGNDSKYFIRPSSNSVDMVLKVGDNFAVYGDGKLYANSGTIGNCKINEDGKLIVPVGQIDGTLTVGKINFKNTNYYIDPTGSSYYYLNLPDLTVSTAGQTIFSGTLNGVDGLFSGELFAATGSFAGELTAATGSFSGSMTCYGGNYTTTIDDGYITLEHKYNNYNLYGMLTGAYYNVSGGPLGQAFECGLSPYYKQAFCGITSHYIVFTKDNAELSGTWIGTSDLPITSDETRKNNISSPSDEYEILFDNLNPVVYKYNDGTSGRLHTGYTSQGVCSAIEKAGLTTQDFAGYVLATTINQETGEEETFGRLRYGEFVALNTWQIQKAKTRISELEAQVTSLTDRLEALEKGE